MTDSDRDIFQSALSDFTFEAACGGAIRHLADSGCTAKQIMERLDYPISEERVRKALYRHLCDSGVILDKSPEEELPNAKPEYVLEYNSYGKPSYRRKNTADAEGSGFDACTDGTVWKEMIYRPVIGFSRLVSNREGKEPGSFGRMRLGRRAGNSGQRESEKAAEYAGQGAELSGFLSGYCSQNREEPIYLSCDFGIPDSAAAKGIALLNGRQKEYLEGILWPRHRVYHRLDHRMKEIVCSLYEQHAYEGVCCLLWRKEKWKINTPESSQDLYQ